MKKYFVIIGCLCLIFDLMMIGVFQATSLTWEETSLLTKISLFVGLAGILFLGFGGETGQHELMEWSSGFFQVPWRRTGISISAGAATAIIAFCLTQDWMLMWLCGGLMSILMLMFLPLANVLTPPQMFMKLWRWADRKDQEINRAHGIVLPEDLERQKAKDLELPWR